LDYELKDKIKWVRKKTERVLDKLAEDKDGKAEHMQTGLVTRQL
jgi:hypothetical protein